MSQILQRLDGLSPFVQSVLGCAVFAFLVWLSSKIVKWIISLNKILRKAGDVDLMKKYWIHKNYVNTNGLYFFTQGYLFILTKAFQWFLKSFLVISFYFGVTAILEGNILRLFFSILVFLLVFEGNSWLEDKSSEDVIKKVDLKVKEEVLTKLGNPRDKLDLMLGDSSPNKDKQGDKVSKSKRKKTA